MQNIHPWLLAQIKFKPPFCPNFDCPFHLTGYSKDKEEYSPRGWSERKCSPIPTRRFQCKHCRKSFCFSSFKLHFRERRLALNSKIFAYHNLGLSFRAIGRQLNCSEHMVRERVKKMAKWGYLKHAELQQDIKIAEPIVFDGLENFAESQFDPNHINQAIGKDSLFIYDFNFSPLNRKGRMTEEQKRLLQKREQEKGRYNPRAIRETSKVLFERLEKRKASEALALYTDEHRQYERAIKYDLKSSKVIHIQISSKKARNTQNELFAVNHSDLLIRQDVAAFKRETISFAKTSISMIHRFMLFAVNKNYFRPLFVKKQKRRPTANTDSPAMQLGLTDHILKFHEFFDIKPSPKRVPLNADWSNYFNDYQPYKRELVFVRS